MAIHGIKIIKLHQGLTPKTAPNGHHTSTQAPLPWWPGEQNAGTKQMKVDEFWRCQWIHSALCVLPSEKPPDAY